MFNTTRDLLLSLSVDQMFDWLMGLSPIIHVETIINFKNKFTVTIKFGLCVLEDWKISFIIKFTCYSDSHVATVLWSAEEYVI